MITLYLDMDGVLANFDKAYRVYDPEKNDRKKFRSSVLEGKIFENLEMMPNAMSLLQFVQSYDDVNIEILTSKGTFDAEQGLEAARQKQIWLNKHKIPYKANFTRTKTEKSLYAHQFSILIDDSIGCIEPFNQKGGRGILHNDSSHKETLFKLNETLEELKFMGATAL
jgi:hypothetical protein